MTLKRVIFGILLVVSPSLILAQDSSDPDKDRQYVTDQLRLSLYQEADSGSQVITLLQSGDLLLVDEISGPYALVTSPDGTKGWVKRGFLVTKPTANLLLLEEQKKTQALASEIEKLGNSKVIIDQYEKDMDKLVEKIDELEEGNSAAVNTISELEQVIDAKQMELERKKDGGAPPVVVLLDILKRYWQYLLPIVAVIILLSFVISKQIVEARIKSKFHGIKIW